MNYRRLDGGPIERTPVICSAETPSDLGSVVEQVTQGEDASIPRDDVLQSLLVSSDRYLERWDREPSLLPLQALANTFSALCANTRRG